MKIGAMKVWIKKDEDEDVEVMRNVCIRKQENVSRETLWFL